MALQIKLDEAVTDRSIRKLNELRFKITGAAGKGRLRLNPYFGTSIVLSSEFGSIKFYQIDGTLIGESVTVNTTLTSNTCVYDMELSVGTTDYLTITPNTRLYGVGDAIGQFYYNDGPVMESITTDTLFQFIPSKTTSMRFGNANKFEGINNVGQILECLPSIVALMLVNTQGVPNFKPEDIANYKMSSIGVQGIPVDGDAYKLPSSLQTIFFPGSYFTFSSGQKRFDTLSSVEIAFWAVTTKENAIADANRFLQSVAFSSWTGVKVLKLRGTFAVGELDQTYITNVQAKGVTVSINP